MTRLSDADLAPFQGPPGPTGAQGPQGLPGYDSNVSFFNAAQDLGGQRVIGLGPGGSVLYAAAEDPTHPFSVLGVSTGAALAGTPIGVRTSGDMIDPSWSWVPGPIWVGAAGALTQTFPVLPALAFRQQVAFAVSPIRILIAIRMAIRLS